MLNERVCGENDVVTAREKATEGEADLPVRDVGWSRSGDQDSKPRGRKLRLGWISEFLLGELEHSGSGERGTGEEHQGKGNRDATLYE